MGFANSGRPPGGKKPPAPSGSSTGPGARGAPRLSVEPTSEVGLKPLSCCGALQDPAPLTGGGEVGRDQLADHPGDKSVPARLGLEPALPFQLIERGAGALHIEAGSTS